MAPPTAANVDWNSTSGSHTAITPSTSPALNALVKARTTSVFADAVTSGVSRRCRGSGSSLSGFVRQAHGGERLRPFAEVLHPNDQSTAEGGHLVIHRLVDLQSAALAASVVAKPGRDTVTDVDELLRLQPQLVERLVQPLPEALDLLRSLARVRALALGKHPLDMRIEGLDRSAEVAPVVCRDEGAGFVDVLLRHRSSIRRCSGFRRERPAPTARRLRELGHGRRTL